MDRIRVRLDQKLQSRVAILRRVDHRAAVQRDPAVRVGHPGTLGERGDELFDHPQRRLDADGVVQWEAELDVDVRRHRRRRRDDVLHQLDVWAFRREVKRGDPLGRLVEPDTPCASVRVDDERSCSFRVGPEHHPDSLRVAPRRERKVKRQPAVLPRFLRGARVRLHDLSNVAVAGAVLERLMYRQVTYHVPVLGAVLVRGE